MSGGAVSGGASSSEASSEAALAAGRLAAAGLVVPEDLRAGVLAGCVQLMRMAALLGTVPLEPEDEPAGVFRVRRDDDAAA